MNKEELVNCLDDVDTAIDDLFDTFKVKVGDQLYVIAKALDRLEKPSFTDFDPKQTAYLAVFGSPEEQEWGAAFKEAYNNYTGDKNNG